MATSDSREFSINATPEEILDVIADVETAPQWSSQHQSAEVLERGADGRPSKVRLRFKTIGITDEQTVQYTWTDRSASWTLLESAYLKSQDVSYSLTPDGDGTRVRFEITIGPSIPVPGFVLKRLMTGALETATDGLRRQVLKVKRR